MAHLSELSGEIAELHAKLAPAVAQVDARAGRAASGILWAPGLIVTANHVLEDEDNVVATAPPGQFRARIVGRDPATDLALLTVDGIRATPADRGRSADLRTGHLVFALGNPGGHQITAGIVSGLGGDFRNWRGGEPVRLIQTTAQLRPGFSGGPLVDAQGRVVGVNSWNFGRGVSTAIGVDAAEKIVNGLRAHGRIRRPYLGLGSQPVRLPDALQQELGQEYGMLIVTIEPDGPAARAGLLQGDIIVTIKGDKVYWLDGLLGTIQTLEIDTPYPFGVVRGGVLTELSISPGERL